MTAKLHLTPTPSLPEETSPIALPLSVVLAEAHPLMRRGLRLLLDHEADFEVLAEAASIASAELAVEQLHPQILVLDLYMPGGSSVELIDSLRPRAPQIHIVVLTMEHTSAFARYMLAAGATGFAVKELADTELPQAIRAAARGEQYVSPLLADGLRSSESRVPRLHSADGRAGVP